jgi:hypothetical protein
MWCGKPVAVFNGVLTAERDLMAISDLPVIATGINCVRLQMSASGA